MVDKIPFRLPDDWAFDKEKGQFLRDLVSLVNQLRDSGGGDTNLDSDDLYALQLMLQPRQQKPVEQIYSPQRPVDLSDIYSLLAAIEGRLARCEALVTRIEDIEKRCL